MPKDRVADAERCLGVTFQDCGILQEALTHRSFTSEQGGGQFNERLEFLGDSVLNLVVTDFIFRRWPGFDEGHLAKLRASLVNAEVLGETAAHMGLGECILMGRGAEQTGGRGRASILGDCLEAVVGAIYLDQGMTPAKKFVLSALKETIFERAALPDFSDFKSRLQELTMEKLQVLPAYRVMAEEGPVHERIFSIEVVVAGRVRGKGAGTSKKRAEQAAAAQALEALEKKYGHR